MTWILDSNNSHKFPHLATGKSYGHRFSNGFVMTEQQYWRNFFVRHLKFKDVTPDYMIRAKHQDPKTALFIHHGGVGDVLFMTPAIKWFHNQYPNCEITVSSSARGADIFMNNTDISLLNIEEVKQIYHNISTEEYDMVFAFDGEITLNPLSQINNVYDIFMDCVGAPINELFPEDKRPVIYVTDNEIEVFKNGIKRIYGVDTKKKKYVVLQYETSSMLRNIEIPKMLKLAREIVKKYGYYVMMIGDKPVYKYYQEQVCPKCEKIVDLNLGGRISSAVVSCENCKTRVKFKQHKQDKIDKKIIFPNSLILREIIMLIHQCEFVVGLDSCVVHIGGAFDKPTLGIYGSFDGDLRLRYNKNARWIQKEVKSGPCFLHGHSCLSTQGLPNYPPCMKAFTIEEIMEEIQKTIDLVPMNKTPFIELTQLEHETYVGYRDKCPVCDSEEKCFVMRRGNIKFFKCFQCEAIYTDIVVDGTTYYDDPEYTGCYLQEQYQKRESELAEELDKRLHEKFIEPFGENQCILTFNNRFLDIGCGAGSIVAKMKELGWESEGLETGDNYLESYKTLNITIHDLIVENFNPEEKFDLILMNHVIEHIHDPLKLFEKLNQILEDDGIISIITPDTDKWEDRNNNWIYFNASFAGEHTIVYNKRSIEYLANKFGFEIIYCEPVEKHHSTDQLWIDLKRRSNGTS